MNRQASPHVLHGIVYAFASQGSAAPSVWLVVVEHASPPRPFPLPFDSHLAPIIALSQPGKQRMIYYRQYRIVYERYRQESKLCAAPIAEESILTAPNSVPVVAVISRSPCPGPMPNSHLRSNHPTISHVQDNLLTAIQRLHSPRHHHACRRDIR